MNGPDEEMQLPPGLQTSYRRGVIDFSNGGGKWKRHFTLQNLLLLVVLAFNTGTWWQGQHNTNEALAERIDGVVMRLTTAELTYARKDVLDAQLKAISVQLTDLQNELEKRR